MKRGIALSGGGTKGSYELGVWKALNELGIDYQIVTGTSIGSINGALMATGDYDRAYELWSTITMEDMMEDGINLTDTIEGMYDQREAIGPFLKKYIKNKGADISPFTAFIETLIEEDKIRKSKTDFGLASRKTRVGKVVSDKMDKTVVVIVEDRVAHKTYKKIIGRTYRLKAHDENNECGVGDIVRVMETRPLSKDKRWRVVEIVEKAK